MVIIPKEVRYWESNREWWEFNEEAGGISGIILTEKAPPEAVESFRLYEEWLQEINRRQQEMGGAHIM